MTPDRSTATPAPCLLLLRRQVDERWPLRDRSSDGIMGDPAHQRRHSDHNLGNAIDLTDSPATGFDAHRLAEAFRRQMHGAASGRITYLISRRRIASPIGAWSWRAYEGPDPHVGHIHISISAGMRDVLRSWRLD